MLHDPRHPYSVGLLRCIPRAGARKDEGRLDTIPGFLPQLGAEIPGCVFSDRCALAKEICVVEKPPLHDLGGRRSRCHFHDKAQDLPRETSTRLDIPRRLDRSQTPVLRVDSLAKTFRQSGHDVHALADVSASLWAGETLGLVGESGSGKTTFARTLLGIIEPTAGHVDLDGRQLPGLLSKRNRDDVRAVQIVFQNPDSALNRRHSIRKLLGRTLKKLAGIKGKEAEARMLELTQEVRLAERYLSVRPTQLSGGQKQRVAIARAFAGSPRVVVCDEPTSALDVSVQAAILNLLGELQARENVSYVFISHDLGVVRYLSDRIAVLYLGRLMELGPAEVVFGEPHHPYTEALLSAVATIDGEGQRIRLEGEIPSAANPPSGCVFHTRCPRYLGAICDDVEPAARRGRARAHDALPHPARGASADADGRAASAAAAIGDRVKVRAAVLPETGGRLEIAELELEAPHAGEALVRLYASGVCHSDLNAIDGTATTPCPAVLGHEGAGIVEAVGPGVRRVRPGPARRALLGTLVRCVRRVPARPAPPLLRGLARDGHRRSDGLDDPAVARRRARLPLLVPLDVRRAGRRAGALARADPRRRAVRRRRARRLCRDDGRRRRLVLGEGAPGRPRRGHRLRRCRALCGHGRRRCRCVADRRGRRVAGEARGCAVVRCDARGAGRSPTPRSPPNGCARRAGEASTTRSRRPGDRRDASRVPLDADPRAPRS